MIRFSARNITYVLSEQSIDFERIMLGPSPECHNIRVIWSKREREREIYETQNHSLFFNCRT